MDFLILLITVVGAYTQINSKAGLSQGGALSLRQAKPAPKQLNLKSLAIQAGTK